LHTYVQALNRLESVTRHQVSDFCSVHPWGHKQEQMPNLSSMRILVVVLAIRFVRCRCQAMFHHVVF